MIVTASVVGRSWTSKGGGKLDGLDKCLLRRYGEKFCSPLNGLYIGLHGANGNGGRLANASIPEDYHGVLFDNSPVKEDQPDIYGKLQSYIKSFDKQFEDVVQALKDEGQTDNQVRIKSLYLWSESPGTGKTTTAAALLNEYLLQNFIGTLKRKESPQQRPVYFLDANLLQTEYNTFNRPRVPDDIAEPASRRYYNAMERGKYTEFVVIDDLATKSPTESFRDDLHSVINYRVSNKLPTVYTSNVPIEQLPDIFNDDRLPDRIRDMTMPIPFEGTSERGMR